MSRYKKIYQKWAMKLSVSQRISLYERVHSLVKDGVPIFDSLSVLHKLYTERKDRRAKPYERLIQVLRQGGTFASALEGMVPDAERLVLTAGEKHGRMEQGLEQAVELVLTVQRMRKAVIGAIVYPVLLLCAVLIIMYWFGGGFGTGIFPLFEEIQPVAKWPPFAQSMHYVSTNFTYWILPFLIGLAVFVSFIIWTLNAWKPDTTRKMFNDYAFPWNVHRLYYMATFLSTLASLLHAGMPLNESLQLIYNSSESKWLRGLIERMQTALRTGKQGGLALQGDLFPNDINDDFVIYGNSGNFADALYLMGRRSMQYAEKKINQISASIKTISMMLVALLIALLFMTLYEVGGSVGSTIGQ